MAIRASNFGFYNFFAPPSLDDPTIQEICPDLEAAKTGINVKNLSVLSMDFIRIKMNSDSALFCNAQRYRVSVNDSIFKDLKYRYYRHPLRKNLGLITVLDVDYLVRGEHYIKVEKQFIGYESKVLEWKESNLIPFWKE